MASRSCLALFVCATTARRPEIAILRDHEIAAACKRGELIRRRRCRFFFDVPKNSKVVRCCAPGCSDIGKISCSMRQSAGVPEREISFCSKDCFNASAHVKSSLHRRQAQNTVLERIVCAACGSKVNGKSGMCKRCNKRASTARDSAHLVEVGGDDYSDHVNVNQVGYVQTPQ